MPYPRESRWCAKVCLQRASFGVLDSFRNWCGSMPENRACGPLRSLSLRSLMETVMVLTIDDRSPLWLDRDRKGGSCTPTRTHRLNPKVSGYLYVRVPLVVALRPLCWRHVHRSETHSTYSWVPQMKTSSLIFYADCRGYVDCPLYVVVVALLLCVQLSAGK